MVVKHTTNVPIIKKIYGLFFDFFVWNNDFLCETIYNILKTNTVFIQIVPITTHASLLLSVVGDNNAKSQKKANNI